MPQITLKGNPVKLPGSEVKVGDKVSEGTVLISVESADAAAAATSNTPAWPATGQ